ncbi:MAG: asparagine synthase (glutamine-hydrolyzing) [Bacteroidia bacterium]
MCGISGVVSKKSVDKQSLQKMNFIIKHRGPDDEGFVLFNNNFFYVAYGNDTAIKSIQSNIHYCPKTSINQVDEDTQLAFGHRRLSIIDLSPKGHQPMCSKDERYWITYNGEVYNYLEIRSELEDLGYTFNTNTDTEVIIYSYIQWGQECQHKFNGMWAFAIYDRLEKKLFLSRDRFGIKPLYYYVCNDNIFYFGSEIKQFTVLPNWEAIGNKPRVLDYLFYSTTDHTDETMFKRVFQIKPGHYAIIDIESDFINNDGKIIQKSWYKFKDVSYQGKFEEAASEFRNYFIESVKSHLKADVPVGSALSGGLDSSAVVCAINKISIEAGWNNVQKTFSSVSKHDKYSEKQWIDEVINQIKVEPSFIYPTAEEAIKQIEKITWHMDEPFQSLSPFLSYNVFAKAKKEGIIVLLNGQGADEYLSGYGEFDNLMLKKELFKLNFKLVFNFLNRNRGLGILACIKAIFKLAIPYTFLQKLGIANKVRTPLKKLLTFKINTKTYIHPYKINNYKRLSLIEISNYQMLNDPLQRYLHWEDRNSMANSTEARVPFLDYKLVEFTKSLPLSYLTNLEQTKLILVKALWDILPPKTRERKDKIGYISPEEIWFTNEFKNEFIQLFDNYSNSASFILDIPNTRDYLIKMQDGKIPFSYDYWRIIHLCIWIKVFNVKLVS